METNNAEVNPSKCRTLSIKVDGAGNVPMAPRVGDTTLGAMTVRNTYKHTLALEYGIKGEL